MPRKTETEEQRCGAPGMEIEVTPAMIAAGVDAYYDHHYLPECMVNDAADAALAYAIWDSENTIRMRADCINEHLERARSVRHWLRLHGHDIVAVRNKS